MAKAKAISIRLGMSNERVSVTYCSLAKLLNLINSLLVKIKFCIKEKYAVYCSSSKENLKKPRKLHSLQIF